MPSARFVLPLALSLAAPTALAAEQQFHVAPGQTIQGAIDQAIAALDADTTGTLEVSVIVADGTYTGPGNRDLNMFGRAITVTSVNGPEHTIIDAGGTPTEPYRGFVFESLEGRDSVLQGFTITGGDTLQGAVADQFNGGGVIIRSSSPTLRDIHFIDNNSGCWGGAVYSGDTGPHGGVASPLLENCVFIGNTTDDDGGGFFTWGFSGQGTVSRPVIRNTVFFGNTAAVTGGGITSFGGADLVLENVTVVGNEALFGRDVNIGQATIRDSILWSDEADGVQIWSQLAVTHSIIKGGHEGEGNLDVDPLFAADGFHLRAGSPAIDAGHGLRDLGQLDVDGQPRLLGLRVDIGADEFARLPLDQEPGGHAKP